MGRIVLEQVSKEFPGGVQAVREVSLEIENGEFMVLVGPSGCGKTTILRMIAGLDEVTNGEITIGDRVVTDEKPKDRDIAMVFQNYALYPHMTVEQNIGFGMRLRRTPKPVVSQRVNGAAGVLALLDYLARKPADLSGGQRQRVAIGRAMVREPQAFLMDEPLSNLDAKLRVQMRAELARLHKQLGTTIVYVTHDQVEAMTLGTRVAVVRDGLLQQVDTPQMLFHHPANLFVAGFIGSPTMNLVEATVTGDKLEFGGHRLPVPPETNLEDYNGRKVILGIRPSDFEDAGVWRDERLPVIEVTAEVVEDLGSEAHVLFGVEAPPVQVEGVDEDPEAGTPIPLVAAEGTSVFTAAVDARCVARSGDTVRLSVNPARFHFFDRDSGGVIRARPLPETAPELSSARRPGRPSPAGGARGLISPSSSRSRRWGRWPGSWSGWMRRPGRCGRWPGRPTRPGCGWRPCRWCTPTTRRRWPRRCTSPPWRPCPAGPPPPARGRPRRSRPRPSSSGPSSRRRSAARPRTCWSSWSTSWARPSRGSTCGAAWWRTGTRPRRCSSCRPTPTCWSSAPGVAAGSPACCWGRSATRSCSTPAARWW